MFAQLRVPLYVPRCTCPLSTPATHTSPPAPFHFCLSRLSMPQGSCQSPTSASPITFLAQAHHSAVATAAAPVILLLLQCNAHQILCTHDQCAGRSIEASSSVMPLGRNKVLGQMKQGGGLAHGPFVCHLCPRGKAKKLKMNFLIQKYKNCRLQYFWQLLSHFLLISVI